MVSSDTLAGHLDEAQYGAGVGPCLQAMETGTAVVADDFTDEARWGDYPGHVVASGIRSSMSLPLTVDGAPTGAFNLYSSSSHAFGEQERRRAGIFADQASIALTLLSRQAGGATLNDQLRQALVSRTVIDQAIGIMMGQQQCDADADAAFGLLRAASQRNNRKLRDIASDLVDGVGQTRARPAPRPTVGTDPPTS